MPSSPLSGELRSDSERLIVAAFLSFETGSWKAIFWIWMVSDIKQRMEHSDALLENQYYSAMEYSHARHPARDTGCKVRHASMAIAI